MTTIVNTKKAIVIRAAKRKNQTFPSWDSLRSRRKTRWKGTRRTIDPASRVDHTVRRARDANKRTRTKMISYMTSRMMTSSTKKMRRRSTRGPKVRSTLPAATRKKERKTEVYQIESVASIQDL